MNLDMTLREFFELADRMAAAAKTIRDAQAALGGPVMVPSAYAGPPLSDTPSEIRYHPLTPAGQPIPASHGGPLRSTPQPSSAVVDPPEGLIARGKTGVEIIAERQREEIRKRAEARGEVVALDPKLGLVDAEAMAVKERLRANREQAEREALAKMTDEERREYEGRA